jgi:hypothetical protein
MDGDLPFFNESSLGFLNSTPSDPLPPITIVNSKPLEGPFIAPFVPAPYSVIQEAFSFADLSSDDVLVDLGCGDGRILVAALNHLPLKLCIGVELDPVLVSHMSESHQQLIEKGELKILCKDMFTIDHSLDLNGSTIIILYLLPRGLELLKPILNAWLSFNPKVRRIVTITYSIPEWETVCGRQVGNHWLFLYRQQDVQS